MTEANPTMKALLDSIEQGHVNLKTGESIALSETWRKLREAVGMEKPHAYTIEDGWIETYTGQKFFFRNPKPEQFRLLDVAHALSKTCRYNGHTRFFYCTGEHSVKMMRWARDELLRTFLFHDADEMPGPDVPRPIKEDMPGFKAMQSVWYKAAAVRFDLYDPMPVIVKEADSRILVDERRQVMNRSENDWGTDHLEPLGVNIEGWDWNYACTQFVFEANNLGVVGR